MDYYKESYGLLLRIIDNLIKMKNSEASQITLNIKSAISEKKKLISDIRFIRKKEKWFWIPFYGSNCLKEISFLEENITEIQSNIDNQKKKIYNIAHDVSLYTETKRKIESIFNTSEISFSDRRGADFIYFKLKHLNDANFINDNEKWNEIKNVVKNFAVFSKERRIEKPISAPVIIKNQDIQRHYEKIVSDKPQSGTYQKRGQLTFDFANQKNLPALQKQGPKIWLPVQQNRKDDFLAMGANIDSSVKRGSRLWIPVEERKKFENYLPLIFKEKGADLSFPPIQYNAVSQNLWGIFDSASWNHIRKICYERAGHRCQVCGKQGGSLYQKMTTEEEYEKAGLVDCHEVWEWQSVNDNVGVQKLKRLMVVCKDCHFMFHEGFLRTKARDVGIEDKAVDYINKLRCAVNKCSIDELHMQLAKDNAQWENNKSIDNWIMDLSHLGNQDFMEDFVPTLKKDNKAGVSYDMIAGVKFKMEENNAIIQKQDIKDVVNNKKFSLKYR